MASIVNLQPTLELSPTQVFHFADDTDSRGCCCWWRSRPRKPKEYYVNKDHELTPMRNTTKKVEARIVANQRLAQIVRKKFHNDAIANNLLFDQLRDRINYRFEDDKITEDRLIDIIRAINEIKAEMSTGTEEEGNV